MRRWASLELRKDLRAVHLLPHLPHIHVPAEHYRVALRRGVGEHAVRVVLPALENAHGEQGREEGGAEERGEAEPLAMAGCPGRRQGHRGRRGGRGGRKPWGTRENKGIERDMRTPGVVAKSRTSWTELMGGDGKIAA